MSLEAAPGAETSGSETSDRIRPQRIRLQRMILQRIRPQKILPKVAKSHRHHQLYQPICQNTGQENDSGEEALPEPGLPLQVQAASALPNELGMGRSLRPFMRKVPSRTQQELDEIATVNRIAEEGIWIPVMQAARESVV